MLEEGLWLAQILSADFREGHLSAVGWIEATRPLSRSLIRTNNGLVY
jgi:hypothetical protein